MVQWTSIDTSARTDRNAAGSYRLLSPGEIAIPALASLMLIGLSTQGYLLFHTLVELSAIGIATLLFVVAWYTYPLSRNNFLMILASSYIWVGMLDMLHTLVYRGMGVLPVISANPATQLWIVARGLEAVALVAAPGWLGGRPLSRAAAIAVPGVVAVLMTGEYSVDSARGMTTFEWAKVIGTD